MDNSYGKAVEVFQEVVYDNLPGYCNFYKHQGHEEAAYRLHTKKNTSLDQVKGGVESYE